MTTWLAKTLPSPRGQCFTTSKPQHLLVIGSECQFLATAFTSYWLGMLLVPRYSKFLGGGGGGTVQFAPSLFARGPICPENRYFPTRFAPPPLPLLFALGLGLGLGLKANRVGLQECGQIGPGANSTPGKSGRGQTDLIPPGARCVPFDCPLPPAFDQGRF
jgi:hypothetical protein